MKKYKRQRDKSIYVRYGEVTGTCPTQWGVVAPAAPTKVFFLNWMLVNSKNDMIFIQTWHITVKLKLKIKLNIIKKQGKAHLICAASQARALDLEAARLDCYRVKPLWRCLKTRTCSRSLGHLDVTNQGKYWWWNLFHRRGTKPFWLWIYRSVELQSLGPCNNHWRHVRIIQHRCPFKLMIWFWVQAWI